MTGMTWLSVRRMRPRDGASSEELPNQSRTDIRRILLSLWPGPVNTIDSRDDEKKKLHR